jgi:hypothetical protein
MSLLYTVQALDRSRYRPIIAVIRPSPEVIRLYADQGFETIPRPGIYTLEHTSSVWRALHRPQTWPVAIRTIGYWADSERRMLALVDSVQPDLVHLNSAVLVPSAHALYRKGIPFVWHVREGPAYGHPGLRLSGMHHAILRWPSELISLTEAERFVWIEGTRARVIPKFADFTRFDRSLNGK